MPRQYVELVIDGDEKSARAYIDGFLEGRRLRSGLFFCRDYDISSGHLDFLDFLHDRTHLLCRSDILEKLRPALDRAPEYMKLRVLSEKAIQGLSFEFKFETKSEKVGRGIKRLLRALPAGARLSDFEEKEEREPGAKGVEGYAPMPEYRYHGHGRIAGDVEAVLRSREKLCSHEFVDVEEAKIDF